MAARYERTCGGVGVGAAVGERKARLLESVGWRKRSAKPAGLAVSGTFGRRERSYSSFLVSSFFDQR